MIKDIDRKVIKTIIEHFLKKKKYMHKTAKETMFRNTSSEQLEIQSMIRDLGTKSQNA